MQNIYLLPLLPHMKNARTKVRNMTLILFMYAKNFAKDFLAAGYEN